MCFLIMFVCLQLPDYPISMRVLPTGCEREVGITGDPLCAAYYQQRQLQAAAASGQVWQVCCSIFGGKLDFLVLGFT